MVANIAHINGKAAMAYADREEPWHQLGTALPEGMLHAKDVMVAASLDWNVELKPTYRLRVDGVFEELSNRFAVVRDVDETVLGNVGKRYEPLQNDKAFEAMDTWLQDGRLVYETAGALGDGARIFILARLGEDFLVGGKDPVSPYALLTTSHNGSTCVTIKLVTTRVVCANTLAAALGEKGSQVNIRHTRSVEQRISNAAQALGLISRRQQALFEQFEKLAQMKASDELRDRVFAIAVPELAAEASDAAHARQKAERLSLFRLYNESPTVDLADKDTRWGVFNAVTEYLDWLQPRSGQNIEKNGIRAIEKRALYSLEGVVATKRQKVFNILTAAK